jgi:hypothetical protein
MFRTTTIVVQQASQRQYIKSQYKTFQTYHNIVALRLLTGDPDRITALSIHPSMPFHFAVCTTNAVCLLDQRFTKSPLLKWNHHNVCSPNYAVIKTLADGNLIFTSAPNGDVTAYHYMNGAPFTGKE